MKPEKEEVLKYIENFECFWNPKHQPLNTQRSREGLPQLTPEQVIERRREILDSFFEHEREIKADKDIGKQT